MKKRYHAMKAALDEFMRDKLSAEGLKPHLAPSGIYQQKDGAFMVRVRVNGGEITGDTLAGLAGIAEASGGYAHLTSRQDIQLHNVPAARIMEAVSAADRLGLPFKGGGGNTYRNTIVSAYSGMSEESVFDVYPFAHAINRVVNRYEKAFSLPRKFKIGFFASEDDVLRAAVQDLGFVAMIRDGRQGFTVFAGGGQGRESAVGLKLFDFLDAENCACAALALLDLFHDHGDRANRHQARLRFVLKRLGAEAFLRLYLGYYAQTRAPRLHVSSEEHLKSLLPQLKHGRGGPLPDGFELWEQIAVQSTRFGDEVKAVRLFVPYGNLTAVQLRGIAALAKEFCPAPLRLLVSQDILLPLVHASALAELYARLRGELDGIDLTFTSYKGHLVTCVGASICKIGMVDTTKVADQLAAVLDRYLPPDTPEKVRLLKVAVDGLRISGCPNSCAGHHVARVGIGCVNQKVDGVVQPFARVLTGAGVYDGVPQLSREKESLPLMPVAELCETVVPELLRIASENTAG